MLPLPGVVRRLALALTAGAVVAGPLVPGAVQAQEPAGTTVVGELVQAWPEARHDDGDAHPAAAQPLTWVEMPDGEAVRVRADDVSGVPVGSTVEVTVGAEVADPADVSGLDPARDVLDTRVVSEPALVQPPARALTNEVTVVLVTPAGAPRDAVRPADVAEVVDGPVADFWHEQTGGAVELGVAAVHDWVSTTAGCDRPAAMWDSAAKAVGFQAGPGRHLLVYVSGAADGTCAYGLAEVGSLLASGGRVYVRELTPSLIAHELGHNFGLGHSSALHCASGAEGGGCRTAAYGDRYDVMGGSWGEIGSLNVVQAARLGLLAPDTVRTLQADGVATPLTLSPLTGASGVRAVRLLAPGGREYWLELRTAAGRDAWLAGGGNRFGLQAGVLVRRAGTWPDTSLLIDPTPTGGPDGDFQTALPPDRQVSLAGGAFTVTVGAVGPDGVQVQVRSTVFGAAPAPAVPAAEAPDVLPSDDGARATARAPESSAPAAPVQAQAAGAVPAAAPAPAEQVDASPAVVPTSAGRPLLLPALAGAVLGCAALLVTRQLVRGRARR